MWSSPCSRDVLDGAVRSSVAAVVHGPGETALGLMTAHTACAVSYFFRGERDAARRGLPL